MKKVLIQQSIAGQLFSYRPGETAELEEALANAWVASGIAVWPPKVVAPKPEVAKAEVKAEVKPEVVKPEVKAEFAVAPVAEVTVPVKIVTKVEDAKKGE